MTNIYTCKSTIFWLFILFLANNAFCQLGNDAFFKSSPHPPAVLVDSLPKKALLSIELRGLFFLKNNEYFEQLPEGYTLFGYQVTPTLVFNPSKNVTLQAGAFVWKDFGNRDFTRIAPTFSFQYNSGNFSLIMGTLKGALQHELIEPLYDFENVIQNRLENGLQFLWENGKFETEVWIDWRTMIYQESPFQEEIVGGARIQKTVQLNRYLSLSPSGQFITYHLGGQINTSTLPVTTSSNYAVGLKVEKAFIPNKNTSLSLEGWWVGHSHTGSSRPPYANGNGLYLHGGLAQEVGQVYLSYWNTSRYFSPLGGELFPTYLAEDIDKPRQEILMLRIFKEWSLSDKAMLTARAEPFYDFSQKVIEYSFGLYLNYNYGSPLVK